MINDPIKTQHPHNSKNLMNRTSKYRIPNQKVYYAHNMSKYGTIVERNELQALEKIFFDCEIINPADYEEKWENLTEDEKMAQCFELVKNSEYFCFTGINVTSYIYYIGKGVCNEFLYANKLKKSIFFLSKTPTGMYKLTKNFNVNTRHIVDWTYFAIVEVFLNDVTIKKQITETILNKHLSALFLPIGSSYETFILNYLINLSMKRDEQLYIFIPFNDFFFLELKNFFLKLPRTNSFNWLVSFLFGKRNYCLKYTSGEEIECTDCEFKQEVEKLDLNDEYYILEELVTALPTFNKISDIKDFLQEYGCPYFFFVNSIDCIDICITNHAYLKTTNQRLLFLDRMLKNSFVKKNCLVFDSHLFGPVIESTLDLNRLKNIISVTSSPILRNYFDKIQKTQMVPQNEDLRSELEKEYRKLPKLKLDSPLEKDFEYVYDFFNVQTRHTRFNNKMQKFEKIERDPKSTLRFLFDFNKTVLLSNKMYPRKFFDDYYGLDLYNKLKLPFNNGNLCLISHNQNNDIYELLNTTSKLNYFGNTLLILGKDTTISLEKLKTSGYLEFYNQKQKNLKVTTGKKFYYIDDFLTIKIPYMQNSIINQFKIIIVEEKVLFKSRFHKVEYHEDLLKSERDFESFYLSNYQNTKKLLSIIELNKNLNNDFTIIIILSSDLNFLLSPEFYITTKSIHDIESVIKGFWRDYSVF